MKTHTTNYSNTFIAIAADCKANRGERPSTKNDSPTSASIQFDLISKHPYKYTSDDVLFQVYAAKHDLATSEWPNARSEFFSKGQPCLRASPLGKRYGWGIHHDKDGKVALYGCETPKYEEFLSMTDLQIVSAMKSSK